MRAALARWVARRGDLARQHYDIARARIAARKAVEELSKRRDGFRVDARFDGAIDALLDLADELGVK